MRQEHRAGEKLFVDFPGQTIPIYDRKSGEVTLNAELFVAVAGVELPLRRGLRLPGALVLGAAHTHAFNHGGCHEIVVCRQPEIGRHPAAPLRARRERHFQEMAAHYGVAIIPTRTYKPGTRPRSNKACSWPSAG